MPIKVFKNTTYEQLKIDLNKQTAASKSKNPSQKKNTKTKANEKLLAKKIFFLRKLFEGLLVIAGLLIVYFGLQLYNYFAVKSMLSEVPGKAVQVEIVKKPNFLSPASENIWQCNDGRFVTNPKLDPSCVVMNSNDVKSGSGNKFFNPSD